MSSSRVFWNRRKIKRLKVSERPGKADDATRREPADMSPQSCLPSPQRARLAHICPITCAEYLAGVGWRAQVHPGTHPVNELEFDVIIGADGRRNTLPGKWTCNRLGVLCKTVMCSGFFFFSFLLSRANPKPRQNDDLTCVQLWPSVAYE